MLKTDAHPSFVRQVFTQILLLALLGQSLVLPARAAGVRPRVWSQSGGGVADPLAGLEGKLLETVQSDAGGPSADGAPGPAPQAVSCPAAGGRPAASRLTYTGRVVGHCGEPLPVSARLTDECGNALAGRRINFTAGSVTASAVTDDNGVASTSLVPPPTAAPLPLDASFAGGDDYAPARDSAPVRVARVRTSLRYTGKAVLAAGVAETVGAVLTETLDGSPVPGAELVFEVGSARVAATTDANGVAAANLLLPPAETFERAPLKITYAGDDCRGPASATAEVTAYMRSSFVVWGGNAERLRLGQRVNFWGHSWAKQVSAGDYKAHNDFKGYADTVRQFQLCQVSVRTTSAPPLNDSCWSTKPGQSFPPETIPEHIGVIVTTSADKRGAPDFGNIAALVVVKVSPTPRYGADPGKPGFGTIVAVIADGEGIFPQPPSITASQVQPATALPAQSLSVAVTLANDSTSPAAGVSIGESFAGALPPAATARVGALPARESRTHAFGVTLPGLPSRREGESSRDYEKRLGAADGTIYPSEGVVSFQDATGRALPAVSVSSFSRLQIPRLAVGISATPCVSPGASIPYVVKLTNVGGGVAAGATAVVTFPDGTTTRVEATDLEPGKEFSATVNWKVPTVAAKGASETDADYLARLTSFDGKALSASASVTWSDALGNAYGAVEQECAGVLRVPVLSLSATPPPPMLPGQKVTLAAAVRNAGGGSAPQARLRVNNPDASVFDAPPFSLPAGGSSDVPATLTAPPVLAKGVDETDDVYRARLRSSDNQPIDFSLALEWTDAAGNAYGPVAGLLRTTEVLPILLLTLGARETVESGEAVTYRVTAENVGHAEAAGLRPILTLPGGKVQPLTLPAATLPPGGKQSVVVDFPVPAAQPEGRLSAQASTAWGDAAANVYGPVSAGAVTDVINPNRPPIVNAGPDQSVVLPAAVRLPGAASDDGKPAGSTLSVLWTKVSGPGAVAFANPSQAVTDASFTAEGTYILRLTADDSLLSASDEAIIIVTAPPAGPTYGGTADFSQGEGVNVVRDEYNHLHVKNEATPFNFIWVAVSSRGTIVKVDTDTGKVVGEYFSSPDGQPKNPSRTTVDHNGNVWASNRDGNSVLRIGLAENGQCVDRNGNGRIETSKGQDDVRPWTNAGGVDTDGGVETAQDECVINYTRVRARGTRHVSVNAANDVWVSGTGGQQFDLLDGVTGQIKRQEPSVGHGGYGGLIDKKGVIWSARPMLRWDTALPLKGASGGNWRGYGHDSYGLCIDGAGNVWNTSLGGNVIRKFAPDGTLLGAFPHGDHWAQGCVVDMKGHVWVAHSLYTGTVGHLKPDGTFLGNVAVGSGPTGVAVDAKGKVWATNHNSRTVSRIDPELGPMGADGETRVGQVDLTTVDLKGHLYNYSDMTGSTLSGAPVGGTWTQLFDSGIQDAEWGVVGWTGSVCGDASLLVTVSSSGDGVTFSAPVAATNGAGFAVPRGRYLKVSVAFKRASSGESPFLYDLTAGTKGFKLPAAAELPPTVNAGPDQTATMPNHANLVGTACDASRVSALGVSWEKVSGPGEVSFVNARVPGTSAKFSEAGEYTLRLTAADATASSSDEMTVLVLPFNDPPAVNAGPDQTLVLPSALSLNGSVKDDALPRDSSVTVSWSKLSGPGEVTFADSTAAVTAATFGEPGDYVLRLTGNDSQLANVDDLSVTVYPPNAAPSVDAGGDLTIRLPEKAHLDAAVTDDGLPPGKTVAVAWMKVSGPGTVSFANANAAETTAGFGLPGEYVLRLTAGDSQLSTSDELTVTVKPANRPPQVNAGPDQTITLPDAAGLAGSATDDGLPEGRGVNVTWTKVSGPGLVTFAAPGEPATAVTFGEPGAYVLRLSASDSALTGSDDVAVNVNPSPVNLPPTVSAGPDQTVTLPANAVLVGVAGDDRQPAGGALSVSWSKVSGPGAVTFGNAAAAATTAAFSVAGDYVLRLTAGDTQLTAADEINIRVLPVNQPPAVSAGADQLISFPSAASLLGTATDDGVPADAGLTVAWSKVSGPGEVTFAAATAAATTAAFSTGGQYVLRLTASDSAHSRSDDVAVTVNQAPSVEAGADQSIHLPAATASLDGTVRDDALPPGKTIVVAWTKVSGPGTVAFSKPSSAVTTATFGEVGTYVLRLTANDSLLADGDELKVEVLPPLPPPPSVSITRPSDGADITSRVEVVGSVSGGNWKVEYSLGADETRPGASVWTTVASGGAPVSNGVLGTFDPTLLLNGSYKIRLTATDAHGQTTSFVRSAIVTGGQKVGHFTLSFEDLHVPVAGLPIQLVRTYDSRDKRRGDFGVGWTLGINSARLEKTAPLGRYWRETVSPGVLPQYCLQATRPNIVTVTLPDDRVYKFQATTARQCQSGAPLTFARFAFAPMPGTQGTLVPEAPLDLVVEGDVPGVVELLDASDPRLEVYDPTLFRFTNEEGLVFVIDQHLGVRSVADPNGNRLTVDRDGITHSSGKGVAFARDALGRITQITDPQGVALAYTYDGRGDLTAFKDGAGSVSRYTYDEAHYLLSLQDPRGITPLRNEYDDDGRLISHTDANGKTITYARDLNTRQEVTTDRLGRQTLVEYDDKGHLLRQTDPDGGVTSYTYDARGNELSRTDPLGRTSRTTYDANNNKLTVTDPLGRVAKFTYNARGQQLTRTDPAGHVITHAYDARGNLTSVRDAAGRVVVYTYTAAGLPATVTDAGGNVRRFEYDGFGNRTKETDPLGHVTAYTYDAAGRRLGKSTMRSTPSGTSAVTTTNEYDAGGKFMKTTFPDGTSKQQFYDALGRTSAVVDSGGRRTEYVYDAMGNLTKTLHPDGTKDEAAYDAEGRRVSSTDRAGRTSRYAFDNLGRLVKTTYPDGTSQSSQYDAAGQLVSASGPQGGATRYEYDAGGRRTKVTDATGNATTFTYHTTDAVRSVTDARGNTTVFEYDESGRHTRTVYPDGTESRTAYGAASLVSARTDQAGNTTSFEYDKLGRLVRVTDAAAGVTAYAYDEAGNLISQTDAAGRRTSFRYDVMNRRVGRTLPLGMSETFFYDDAGNMTRRTDFNGKVTTLSYDAMGRLVEKRPDPTLAQPNIRFTYTPTGRRATMTDAGGTTTYAYDVHERPVRKATPQGTLTYAYDAAGRVKSVRSSNTNGVSVDYSYDALGRLASVNDNAPGAGSTVYGYDAVGNLDAVVYANGVETKFAYNSLNRLVKMTAQKSAALASYDYTLGAAGNRVSVFELGGRRVDYTYDRLYRVTGETVTGAAAPAGSASLSYTYDEVGNRLERASTLAGVPPETYGYDANDRPTSAAHDANGNLTSKGGRTYAYDFEDRLTQVDGGAVALVYDGDGNRVAKTAGGATTRYLVDDFNPTGFAQVVEELRDGAVTRQYTYGHDLVSQRQLVGGEWRISYYGYDGHGSVRYLTDEGGAVTDSYDYDAFGNLIRGSGTTPNLYLYAGEQFDPDLGLIYLRARYLDTSSGRFLTTDPYGGSPFDPVTLHRYLYAGASPVDHVDPSGRQFFTIRTLVIIALLGAVGLLSMSSAFVLSIVRWPRLQERWQRDRVVAGIRIIEAGGVTDISKALWQQYSKGRIRVVTDEFAREEGFHALYRSAAETLFIPEGFFYEEEGEEKYMSPIDDIERAALLLHEGAHIQGSDQTSGLFGWGNMGSEYYAYTLAWEKKGNIAWTADVYGDTRSVTPLENEGKATTYWRAAKFGFKIYAPALLRCADEEYGVPKDTCMP